MGLKRTERKDLARSGAAVASAKEEYLRGELCIFAKCLWQQRC